MWPSVVRTYWILALVLTSGCWPWHRACQLDSRSGVRVRLETRALDDAGMSEVQATVEDQESRHVGGSVYLALCCSGGESLKCDDLALHESIGGDTLGLYRKSAPDEIILLVSLKDRWVVATSGDSRHKYPPSLSQRLMELGQDVDRSLKMPYSSPAL